MTTEHKAQDWQAVGSSEIVSRVIGYHEMEAYSYQRRVEELKRDIAWNQERADEHRIMAQTLRHLAANAEVREPRHE